MTSGSQGRYMASDSAELTSLGLGGRIVIDYTQTGSRLFQDYFFSAKFKFCV